MALALQNMYKGSDGPKFFKKVINYSYRLGIDPNWWMFLFDLESGVDPSRINGIGCVGLNQFCPDYPGGSYKTIGGRRIELSTLRAMKGSEQIDYVYEFFRDKAGQFKSFTDLYLYNLLPAYHGSSDDTVLPSWIVSDNEAFDVNKDGKISVKELNGYLMDRVKKRVAPEFQGSFFTTGGGVMEYNFFQRHEREIVFGSIAIIGLIIIGVIAFLLLKR